MGWEREGGVEGGEEEEINDTECRESKKKRNDRRKKRVERERWREKGDGKVARCRGSPNLKMSQSNTNAASGWTYSS